MRDVEALAYSFPEALPNIHSVREQDPFSLVVALISISKSTRALTGLLLTEIDLSVGQDQFLDVLDPDTPLAVSCAATALNVRASTVSKMCDRLVDKGLIARDVHDGDARRTMLRLTDAGVRKREEVRALWARLEDGLNNAGMDRAMVEELHQADTILRKRLSRLR